MAEFPVQFRKAPCYNCESRYPLCHSTCTDYIAYDKTRQHIRKEKEKYYIVANYEKERSIANSESNRRKQVKYRHY